MKLFLNHLYQFVLITAFSFVIVFVNSPTYSSANAGTPPQGGGELLSGDDDDAPITPVLTPIHKKIHPDPSTLLALKR